MTKISRLIGSLKARVDDLAGEADDAQEERSGLRERIDTLEEMVRRNNLYHRAQVALLGILAASSQGVDVAQITKLLSFLF